MKIKICSLLLSLTMLLTFLLSCASKEDADENVTYEGLVITEEYTIVRGENAEKAVIKASSYLYEQIRSVASVNIEITGDFVKRGEEIPSEKQIIIGKTNRVTEFDRSTLKEGEYYIGIEGTNVIIDAYDAETLHFAVTEFVSEWLTKKMGIQKDGVLLINEDMCQKLNGADLTIKDTITILSQNMRYADDEGGNSIDERNKRFKQLLAKYDPDIIGTQETTRKWYNIFNTQLKDEYGLVGCSRDGRNATSGEWSAILYRLERFELLDSDTFWLSDTPEVTSVVPGSLCNRICTWALLKDKQTGKTILMANTHLDHGTDEVRDAQSMILINYLSRKFSKYPFFITGDFNFLPNSTAYKTINKHLLDAHDEAIVDKSTIQYTFHGYGNSQKEIDFCFFNEKSTAISYYIANDDYGGYVSDHYGVVTKFTIN